MLWLNLLLFCYLIVPAFAVPSSHSSAHHGNPHDWCAVLPSKKWVERAEERFNSLLHKAVHAIVGKLTRRDGVTRITIVPPKISVYFHVIQAGPLASQGHVSSVISSFCSFPIRCLQSIDIVKPAFISRWTC